MKIDQLFVRSVLEYSAENGLFFWKPRPSSMFVDGIQSADFRAKRWNSRSAGRLAICDHSGGYKTLYLLGANRFAHRIAWLYVNGTEPDYIDHINGDRADNRMSNLREATCSENMMNRGAPVHSTTGHKNITWDQSRQKWSVQIAAARKNYHVGRFDSLELAIAKRDETLAVLHGEFAHV